MGNEQAAEIVDPYPELVAQSFLEKAVRSVLLIDDQFPMFNTPTEELGRYSQTDRAKYLYRMCKSRKILCDIESRPAVFGDLTRAELLHKSDLVVLDYNLDGDQSPPTKSLNILKKLSETPHFNLVALYTASSDLKNVWLDAAATLKGGWGEPEEFLDTEKLKIWDDLDDQGVIPAPEFDLLVSYLESGSKKAIRMDSGKRLRLAFEAVGVNKAHCSDFIHARVSQEFRTILGEENCGIQSETPLSSACQEGEPFWIQHGNLFVAVLMKESPAAGEEGSDDPEKIWERLVAAVQAWRPNLLQVVMSEIQNILELGGVSIDASFAGSSERQAGILYSLFSGLPEGEFVATENTLRPPIEGLTWNLVESIRRRISTDDGLLHVASTLLKYEVSRDEWKGVTTDPKNRTKELLEFIKTQLLKNSAPLEGKDVFFELNSFLSADKFRGSHLTTGTIFKSEDTGQWWLCCSPACDMVPRQPSSSDWTRTPWNTENHPFKKMTALRLEPVTPHTSSLDKAHHGRRIYIHGSNNEKFQFEALDSNNHPSWEVLLLDKAGMVEVADNGTEECTFRARIIEATTTATVGGDGHGDVSCSLKELTFKVIAQLRPEYASRILQFTGQHLSRIGVDFFGI